MIHEDHMTTVPPKKFKKAGMMGAAGEPPATLAKPGKRGSRRASAHKGKGRRGR